MSLVRGERGRSPRAPQPKRRKDKIVVNSDDILSSLAKALP
jgi:hypothetical protein